MGGEIQKLKLSRDEDGKSRGRAFIEFTTAEAVEKALLFHEKEYAGRTVYVRKADDDSKGKSGKGKGKATGKNGSGRDADRRQEGQASDKHAKEVKEATETEVKEANNANAGKNKTRKEEKKD